MAQSRETYFFYPPDRVDSARTWILDWNVGAQLCAVYKGRTFSKDATTQKRLLDLAGRYSPPIEVVAGFGAAEPPTRAGLPFVTSQSQYDQMLERAQQATVMLEGGHSRMEDYLAGTARADDELVLSTDNPHPESTRDFANLFIRPAYVTLLKAFILSLTPDLSASNKLALFDTWIENRLRYRLSRERWLGNLLLAGVPPARELSQSLLKAQPGRTAQEYQKNIWGAAWDLWISRTALSGQYGSGASKFAFAEPLVFVSDDTALNKVLEITGFIGRTLDGMGGLGLDELPFRGYIEPEIIPMIEQQVRESNERALIRPESKESLVRFVQKNALREQRTLDIELRRLLGEPVAPKHATPPRNQPRRMSRAKRAGTRRRPSR